MNKLLIIGCILFVTTINAQNTQVLLADEYFNKGDYEKSSILYEKLAKKKGKPFYDLR